MVILLMIGLSELEDRLPKSYQVMSATRKKGRWVIRCMKVEGFSCD